MYIHDLAKLRSPIFKVLWKIGNKILFQVSCEKINGDWLNENLSQESIFLAATLKSGNDQTCSGQPYNVHINAAFFLWSGAPLWHGHYLHDLKCCSRAMENWCLNIISSLQLKWNLYFKKKRKLECEGSVMPAIWHADKISPKKTASQTVAQYKGSYICLFFWEYLAIIKWGWVGYE